MMNSRRLMFKVVFPMVAFVALSVFVFRGEQILREKMKENLPDQIAEKIAPLNVKYNLVGVSSLDAKPDKGMELLLNGDAFEANTLNEQKPVQDLIVKVGSGMEGELDNILILKLQSESEIGKIASEYAQIEGIAYAEPDYEMDTFDVDSQLIAERETVEEGADEVEESKIIVGIVDSGADISHPDLRGKTVDGWDFIDDKKKVVDEVGHGTHVAGIVLGHTKNALIMPLKFTNKKSGKMSNAIKAIKYATDNGAKVINLSMGLDEEARALKEAVVYAYKHGVIVVAASGNKNSDEKYYPAAWKEVISVAAVNKKGEKAKVSNYGEWVEFSALGEKVYSSEPGRKHGYRTGTSQAAPVVAAKVVEILKELEMEGDELEEDGLFKAVYNELLNQGKPAKGDYADELGEIIE